MPRADDILPRIRGGASTRDPVLVATCEGEVVAVACLKSVTSIVELRAAFDMSTVVSNAAANGEHMGLAWLEHVVVNPVFAGW